MPALQDEYRKLFDALLARCPTFASCRIDADLQTAPHRVTDDELKVFPFDQDLFPRVHAAWMTYQEILGPYAVCRTAAPGNSAAISGTGTFASSFGSSLCSPPP